MASIISRNGVICGRNGVIISSNSPDCVCGSEPGCDCQCENGESRPAGCCDPASPNYNSPTCECGCWCPGRQILRPPCCCLSPLDPGWCGTSAACSCTTSTACCPGCSGTYFPKHVRISASAYTRYEDWSCVGCQTPPLGYRKIRDWTAQGAGVLLRSAPGACWGNGVGTPFSGPHALSALAAGSAGLCWPNDCTPGSGQSLFQSITANFGCTAAAVGSTAFGCVSYSGFAGEGGGALTIVLAKGASGVAVSISGNRPEITTLQGEFTPCAGLPAGRRSGAWTATALPVGFCDPVSNNDPPIVRPACVEPLATPDGVVQFPRRLISIPTPAEVAAVARGGLRTGGCSGCGDKNTGGFRV